MRDPTAPARAGDDGSARARAIWRGIAPQAPERLVVPGTPAFLCQYLACVGMCCRAPLLAAVTPRDLARLGPAQAGAVIIPRDPWDGPPVPRMRKDPDGACVLLQPEGGCGVYERRPTSCRTYPYELFFATPAGDPVLAEASPAACAAAIAAAVAGGLEPAAPVVPLVTRDLFCPGFTEAALTPDGYAALLETLWDHETARLQGGAFA